MITRVLKLLEQGFQLAGDCLLWIVEKVGDAFVRFLERLRRFLRRFVPRFLRLLRYGSPFLLAIGNVFIWLGIRAGLISMFVFFVLPLVFAVARGRKKLSSERLLQLSSLVVILNVFLLIPIGIAIFNSYQRIARENAIIESNDLNQRGANQEPENKNIQVVISPSDDKNAQATEVTSKKELSSPSDLYIRINSFDEKFRVIMSDRYIGKEEDIVEWDLKLRDKSPDLRNHDIVHLEFEDIKSFKIKREYESEGKAIVDRITVKPSVFCTASLSSYEWLARKIQGRILKVRGVISKINGINTQEADEYAIRLKGKGGNGNVELAFK